MLFNIHHGQMRPDPLHKSRMRYLPKTPKSALIMAGVYDGERAQFEANSRGNIEVCTQKHIKVMVGLGYPIYIGNGSIVLEPTKDLLFPNLNPMGSYWRRINEALLKGGEDGKRVA